MYIIMSTAQVVHCTEYVYTTVVISDIISGWDIYT